MSDVVQIHADADVGHLVLNRPEAMNAITVELGRELGTALSRLAESVRIIVIRGAGGNFSVGGDFKELETLRAQGPGALRPLFENFGRACSSIAGLPVPVIAAVEGHAMAGGFELMQACDIALVHENVKLADNHARFGQIPGGGGSQRLPRLVGRQRALGHLLTGDRIGAEEAVAWGLAYRSLPADGFDEAVRAFAGALAAKGPGALGRIKRLVHEGLRLPLEDGLALERRMVVEHQSGESAKAGIAAFTERNDG
ncbi:enoyl-CoA hydratase/isomerase family protein [Streptomyces sp. NPDC055078]